LRLPRIAARGNHDSARGLDAAEEFGAGPDNGCRATAEPAQPVDRIERFFTGLAAAITAAFAPMGDAPRPAEPIAVTIPAEPVPLPRQRPIAEAPADDGAAAMMMWADAPPPAADAILDRLAMPAPVVEEGSAGSHPPAVADAPAPPLPEPNPLARGAEIAALPPAGGFTPRPPLEHDAACLQQLAALPLAAALLAPIEDENACGIATPLVVARIGLGEFAVALTPEALVDCSVAGALSAWLEEDVQPAARSILGQWVVGIRVAASYVCRGVNNAPDGTLSEHAFGHAIDIAAFQLADGTWIDVRPYDAAATEPAAEFLAAIRAEACGPFTTVLGPGVALHDDHFHLDLAARGESGRSLYCP
jgi:hypothetical protein